MKVQNNKEKNTDVKGNVFDRMVLKRLFQFIKPYKAKFFVLILLTIVLSVLAPSIPWLISYTINKHVSVNNYQGLINTIIILVSVLVVQSFIQFATSYLSNWIGQSIIRDIRIRLFKHLLSFHLKFFDNTPIGRLVTRNVSDIETLSEVFSQGIAAMLADLLTLVTLLIVMFTMNWQLALISLIPFPILLISTYVFKEKMKSAFNEVRTAVSNLNTFVQERVTGMNIVQLFNSEKRELGKFTDINQAHRKAHLKTVKYYSIYFPIADVIGAVSIGLVVWYGARGIVDGFISGPGELVAFIMFINMFFRPIRLIADRFNTLQLGIVSTKRIIDLLDVAESIDKSGTKTTENLKGNVSFENVNFAYKDNAYVLKDISFEVEEGQTVALVGATGAGKSSVINLLSRFYEINSGTIRIDGVDTKEFEITALRKKIGVVLQDVFLFSDTIYNNITLNNPDITREQVWDAAKQVGAAKFIEKLPGQLDYNVQERGGSLSVGQRQLISFIRVMVYNPSIMVLDEATSSVDTETEILIQEAIQKLMNGRTSIVIAHRLSTIQEADKIIVLDKGEIQEMGSHTELIQKEGYYKQLYDMQYKEQD